MKTAPLIAPVLVILTMLYGCEKTVPADSNFRPLSASPSGRDSSTVTDTVPTPPFPQQTANTNPPGNPAPSCPSLPIYGDTLIYPQPTNGSDYVLNPVNNPGAGKYFAWPVGLALDQNTGAIDLTQSQTGMRYVLGFVPSGTTDTCLSTLIVGGAAYYDSVYVIADGQTISSPYFEANPYLPNPCINGGCTFDVNGAAAAKKVIVNTTTGVIDLQKTLDGTGLLGGAFGLLPVDGSVITVPIYYKLNDGSNQALQNISVQIEYMTSKSSISAGILGGIVNQVNDVLSGNIIYSANMANPRPPLIIITRRD